jgi:hypothetical protein
MHRSVVFLVLSACALAAAPAATALAQSAPQPNLAESKFPPPAVFYVAQGGLGACGPGCSEWIAADGVIDGGAGPRLWELLRKLGNDRKPPVFFNSPGGAVAAAFEIAKLLRARGLTVGVGFTAPAECALQSERSCEELKRSGRELVAELDTRRGLCASACVYTIMGGAVRELGAGTRLGVHDTSLPATIRIFDENGRAVDRPLLISTEQARSEHDRTQRALAAYLKAMGVGVDLLTAAQATSPDKLRFLTRDEIAAFGIDRRDVVESSWSWTFKWPGMAAVKLIEARDTAAAPFRKAMLTLTCRDRTVVRLRYVHEVGTGTDSASTELHVRVGGRSVPFVHLAPEWGVNSPRVESYETSVPLAALDEAAFVIEPNATSGQEDANPAGFAGSLRVHAAAPTLAVLGRRCSSGAR